MGLVAEKLEGLNMTAPLARPYGLVAIPARLASTRLPNKLLLSQTGRPLLAYVIDGAREAVRSSHGLLRSVLVACDSCELLALARQAGVEAVLTGSNHQCGTTRIAEAISHRRGTEMPDFVVNVQADEPELAPQAIVQVAQNLLANCANQMVTLAVPMPAGSESIQRDPSAVKVVLGNDGRALYFSRAPIPFARNPLSPGQSLWYHHLGIYAYRTEFLLRFEALPASPLEAQEGLEQLRALSAGIPIQVGLVPPGWAAKGIDTPEDYAAFVRRCAA